MTKEEKKDEMKNRISMALKDPILQQGFEIICRELADLQKENKGKRIEELEQQNKALQTSFDMLKENDEKVIRQMGEQIEKMKCCGNCRFDYCERSSERIDKDGNRTFHCWNEEKEKYCDVGKNGKYQCWEIKEK